MTNRSILALKKRALKRTRTLHIDAESGSSNRILLLARQTRLYALLQRFRALFTRTFWMEQVENWRERSVLEVETLVDSKLLRYAYLEVGVIEMLGS